MYKHIVTKLGISAVGNEPRHDSDATTSTAEPPTNRLKRALRLASVVNYDEETQMSTESAIDSPCTSFALSQTQGPSLSVSQISIDQPSTSTATSVAHSQSQSGSRRRTHPNPEVGEKTPTKRKRTINYFSEMKDVLQQQQQNNELQAKYLKLCVERAEIAKNRENLQLQKAEIELKTTEECMRIEVDKKKTLAKMEIEAKRRELNL